MLNGRGRTTSSHLHVVSAGNSQRNSSTVSECQEELNNAIVPLPMTCRRAKPRPSSLPKHSTYSTATVCEWERRPFHVPPTMENGIDAPIFLPDNGLRQRSPRHTRRRREREGRNMTKTTPQYMIFKYMTTPCQITRRCVGLNISAS